MSTIFYNKSQMLHVLDEFRTVNWSIIDKQLKYSEVMQMFQFA